MAISNVTVSKLRPFLFVTAAVALAALIPARAQAQDPAAPAPVVAASGAPPASSGTRMVGGHVGAAVPVVSFHSTGPTTKTPSDDFTIAVPIGVSVHVAPLWVVDFEVVVASHVKPWGGTGLTIDPGIVYVGPPVALGLRAKFDVSENANFGLIPLIHKGLVDIGQANWFVEAAFPMTATRGFGYELAAVAHTGFAF